MIHDISSIGTVLEVNNVRKTRFNSGDAVGMHPLPRIYRLSSPPLAQDSIAQVHEKNTFLVFSTNSTKTMMTTTYLI